MKPLTDLTLLHDYFDATVHRVPDKVALVCQGQRFTYADLDRKARALGGLLSARGVTRGDRVLLFLDNGVEMVAALYAVLRLGAIVVPVNPLTKKEKLAYLLQDTRATAMVAHGTLAAAWREPASSPHLHTLVCVGDAPAGGIPPACLPWPHEGAAAFACDATIDQDLAAIIYTSGSTGDPKGVMLTHLNMVCAARSVSGYLGLREDDTIICVLPLAFDYGLYQVLMAIKVGATVVLERSFAFPVRMLEIMVRERVTVFPGVPTVFAILMDLAVLEDHDLSAVRLISNTAAALPEEHIRRLRALFPGATLFSMYGLTECKRVTYLPPDQLDVRPTSVGRGMPNEEVWLVDDAGRRLPNGSTGELVIRGSNVMRGYWEKPRETAERLKPGPTPGEMLLHSGDVFRTDAEGWLYFVARKDDIIKSRGEKVSPREVENVICALEGVREAAVIGVADSVLGEAVKAFVVPKEGVRLEERDIIRHCLARLESFMAPKIVQIVQELPKTDTGKVKKAALS
jgi:amino acid adenylation domain-containing protein